MPTNGCYTVHYSVGGRPTVIDDDKRAAIHARRARGETIRTITTGLGISIGVAHKTLTVTPDPPHPRSPPTVMHA